MRSEIKVGWIKRIHTCIWVIKNNEMFMLFNSECVSKYLIIFVLGRHYIIHIYKFRIIINKYILNYYNNWFDCEKFCTRIRAWPLWWKRWLLRSYLSNPSFNYIAQCVLSLSSSPLKLIIWPRPLCLRFSMCSCRCTEILLRHHAAAVL